MDGLFPIIRRQRRPLVVADAPPVVVGNVAPEQSVATKPVETVLPEEQPQSSDAKVTPKRAAR
jgi:hypothetical protein